MPITHKDPDNIKTWDFEINGSVKYDKQFNEHDLYHVSYDIVLD